MNVIAVSSEPSSGILSSCPALLLVERHSPTSARLPNFSLPKSVHLLVLLFSRSHKGGSVMSSQTLKRRVLSFLSATPAFARGGMRSVSSSLQTARPAGTASGGAADGSEEDSLLSEVGSAPQEPLPAFQPATFFEKLAALPGVGAAAAELIPRLFIVYAMATDPETPAWAKALAGATLAYFVCPFDALPDAIPVIGFADDALVATMAFERLASIVTPRVVERGRDMYDKSDVKRRLNLS